MFENNAFKMLSVECIVVDNETRIFYYVFAVI